MPIVIKKKRAESPAPESVVESYADKVAAEHKLVDIHGANYENLIRSLARKAAREDHKAEFG